MFLLLFNYNKFLYILGFLGIVFLLFIKLQQVFIHPWAFGHGVSILDAATTTFYTSLNFWAFYFSCLIKLQQAFILGIVFLLLIKLQQAFGCVVCGVFLQALIFVGNLCCNGWKVLYKIDVQFLHKLLDLVFAQLAYEVCNTLL